MYVTRSARKVENEEVVKEVLDRHGVEWQLTPILPKQTLHSGSSHEMFFMKPNNVDGNGIFMAQFILKPIAITSSPEMHELDSTETIKDSMELLMIEKCNDGNKKRQPNAQYTDPVVIIAVSKRIPRHVKRAVKRLSVPRRFKGEIIISDKLKKELLNSTVSKPRVSQSLQTRKIATTSCEIGTGTKKSGFEKDLMGSIDFGIFGTSLTNFYSPFEEAIKEIANQESIKRASRWKYQLPNPSIWK